MNKKINELYSRLFIILKIYLFQILLFTLFRLGFAIKLIRSENFYSLKTDIFKAFVKGWQFDTAIICYALLLPLLIFAICSFIPSTRLKATSTVLVNWFCGLTTAAFILILFIDQYFYGYFQSHINILIFGLVDDDTSAVMTSVWSDYPIVRIVLVWCTLLVLYSLYIGRINKRNYLVVTTSAWISITGFFVVLGMFFIGMRQSLGTFPLQNHDGSVSQNKDVNLLVINGVWALNSSFDERGKSVDFEQSALSTIKATGYTTPGQATKDYFPETKFPSDLSDSAAFENLFKTTPENKFVETNKPNVVFVFMESMSNYNLNFDSKEMNLMGSLRKHFNSDLVYRNFVSSGNATIQSLENLMINTPISVTQSKFRFISFPSAVAIPFKNAGFENTFITGGESSWRNLNDFVPHQGFASMKGKQDILADNKEASANHWGAYDEYLFDYAYKKLAAKSKQPKFLFIQTTTNHTPFDLPDNYKKGGITMSKSFKKKLVVTEELALKNLNCFQYANNCLGDFLDKIKSSALSKNTIVVVTGDHNNLSLFDFDEAHQLQQRGVPLYNS